MRLPKTRFVAALLALLVAAHLCPPGAQGQQPSAPGAPPIARIVYEGEMAPLLAKLAQEFGVGIGLELQPGRQRTRVKLDLKDATLHDILNAVVLSAPAYGWRESDGAIDVSPVGSDSPVLEASVARLRLSGVGQAEAVDRLMGLSEVRGALEASSLSYRSAGRVAAGRDVREVLIDLDGVSVRRALHRIAASSGGRFWALRRDGNRRDGEFITVSTPDRW